MSVCVYMGLDKGHQLVTELRFNKLSVIIFMFSYWRRFGKVTIDCRLSDGAYEQCQC